MKKCEATLTISVKYIVPDSYTPEDTRYEITELLKYVVDHAAANCMLSGFGDLEVDEWSSGVGIIFGADWIEGLLAEKERGNEATDMVAMWNLKTLDEKSFVAAGDRIADSILQGQTCSICNKPFVGRQEKDNAVVSGENPRSFAHESCWKEAQS